MSSDDNFPTDSEHKNSGQVITLDHFRTHHEIKHLLIPKTPKPKNSDSTKRITGERELSDFGLSTANSSTPDVSETDQAYLHWTTNYARDQKLRELYIRPKLSPIFFDEDLNALNDSLELKLNKCDYLLRKIKYYSGRRPGMVSGHNQTPTPTGGR